ncbi:MAG: hypothetical protein PUG58_00940 [Limosilactobacillus mucosae]|nr:hypothetical protein [Limosilactobacillus mucosae]MDY2944150.1 hypothetical protein [Lachnospiraceae bacterium]
MSFNKRTWIDRVSEYPNRRKLIDDAGTEKTYTVERYEGEISAEGDDWSAANMNDLEQRIADSIDGTASSLAIAEDGTNSANAYSVGSFLSHKGVLYEVVAPISKGDKLDTVTNIKQVTVGQMLEHLVANQKSFVFAYDAATSRYGYTIDGTFHPFRNPTGNAGSADVLAGKTFSSAGLDDATGTMPNRGALNVTLKPNGNNSVSQNVAAGYYSGGTITANGSASYNSGYTDGHAAKKSTTLTISLSMWSSHNDEGAYWHSDVSVNGSHVCGAQQGGATGYYTVTL